jgi:hypothetical protein
MALEITKRPYDWAWSGNPVLYELYSSLAASDTSVYFQVRVMFKRAAEAMYEEAVILDYHPVAGYAQVNLKDILHGLLEYELPGIDNDETKIWEAPAQTGNYYIEFRQITSVSTDPTWDETESAFPKFIVKGGLDSFKYRGNNFWVNYFKQDLLIKFLTWQVNGRLAAIDERIYLAMLNTYETGTHELKTIATVYYTDASNTTKEINNDVATKGVVYYCPGGATQLGLDLLFPDKTIYKWDVQIFYKDGDIYVPLTERFFFESDNRHDYTQTSLFYRNSLGGLDTLRIKGNAPINHNISYGKGEVVEKIRPADYFSGDFVQPAITTEGNREKKTWQGNAGFLKKKEQDRLRDVKLKLEGWIFRNSKWLPVNILAGDWKQTNTEDSTWSMPIEWTLATDGEPYYTPDDIDLGDGVFNDNVCRATISDVVVTKELDTPVAGTARVTIDFTENDPQIASLSFSYQIIGVHVNPIIEQYANLPLVFDLPMDEDYIIKFIPICGDDVQGRTTSKGFNTNAGGGGGGEDCIIANNTNFDSNYSLEIDGIVVRAGFVGANSSDGFTLPDTGPSEFKITFDSVSPADADLRTNTLDVYPPNDITGNVVTWNSITTTDGFAIEIF